MNGIGIGIPFRCGGISYDSDAASLFVRMGAVSETPDSARKQLISDTFAAAKAKAFYNKCDAIVTLAAHGTQSARMNWKEDIYNATLSGTAPSFEIDRGFTGDGAATYIRTNFNPSTAGGNFTLNSASVSLYSRTDQLRAEEDLSSMVGTAGIFLDLRVGNTVYALLNSVAGGVLSVLNFTSTGLFTISREASNVLRVYKEKLMIIDGSAASNAIVNEEIYIGCRNVSGVQSSFSSKQYAFYFIGSGFTQTDINDIYTVFVDGYLDSIGAKL